MSLSLSTQTTAPPNSALGIGKRRWAVVGLVRQGAETCSSFLKHTQTRAPPKLVFGLVCRLLVLKISF